LGKKRLELLKDKNTGFFSNDLLDRQYFIMPQSIWDTYGQSFLENLKSKVNDFYQPNDTYNPKVILYDDRGKKTFTNQGNAILNALEGQQNLHGYAVVMIHQIKDRDSKSEDQLEAMILQELYKRFDMVASVIHTSVGTECHEFVPANGKDRYYRVRKNKSGKLSGYLQNVALNKVLLSNQRWPFVLATPLHADLIVGIDVKNNTAGLVVVGNRGATIRFIRKTSQSLEKLNKKQMQAYVYEILSQQLETSMSEINNIVIHRDGRIYESEISGTEAAIEALKKEGKLGSETSVTFLAIPKTSPTPLRITNVKANAKFKRWLENPPIGSHYVQHSEGYLCSTGAPFIRKGTANPLHIKYVKGTLSIEDCLEDVYYLTHLSRWS